MTDISPGDGLATAGLHQTCFCKNKQSLGEAARIREASSDCWAWAWAWGFRSFGFQAFGAAS